MIVRPVAIALAGVLLSLPALAEPLRIALLPIAVHVQGGDTEYLSQGLSSMIASRLEQYEGVTVLRAGAETGPATNDREAVLAAQTLGAEFVLFGSFTRFGDGASLDLRCAQVVELVNEDDQPPARRTFVHAGSLAEIIPKLDTLSEKVARYAFREQGGAQRLADTNTEGAASSTNGQAPTGSAEIVDLVRRVDALERAVYKPVAKGEGAPGDGTTPESDGTAVR